MGSIEFCAFLFVATIFAFIVVASLHMADGDQGALCAPSRQANITASVPQERRRVLSERTLGPPAGWHEPQHVAIVPAAVPEWDDDLDDWVYWDGDDELEPEAVPAVAVPMAAPVPAPVAVPDWPKRQTVEPPAQVAVNSTAARFGSLEINRD